MGTCTLCGRATESHNRNVRFRLPDPVLRTLEKDQAQGTWKTDDEPNAAVMMMIPHVGAFVRALLPVQVVRYSERARVPVVPAFPHAATAACKNSSQR